MTRLLGLVEPADRLKVVRRQIQDATPLQWACGAVTYLKGLCRISDPPRPWVAWRLLQMGATPASESDWVTLTTSSASIVTAGIRYQIPLRRQPGQLIVAIAANACQPCMYLA